MPDPLVIKLSDPQEVDIVAYRGDSGGFRIAITETDDTPIDVTTATWDADIRAKKNDVIPIANFTVQMVPEETHIVDVILPFEESRNLLKKCYYDIEMTLSGEVVTLVYGTINAGEDVSRP